MMKPIANSSNAIIDIISSAIRFNIILSYHMYL